MKLKVPKYQLEGQDRRISLAFKNIALQYFFIITKQKFRFLYTPLLRYFLLTHNRKGLFLCGHPLQIIFLPRPNLYSLPFNTVLLFLCLSVVEAKETQCFFYSDIIWSTLAISLYIYILPSLCTQSILFLILYKW